MTETDILLRVCTGLVIRKIKHRLTQKETFCPNFVMSVVKIRGNLEDVDRAFLFGPNGQLSVWFGTESIVG